MAVQIVMDRTGDTRHEFDVADAEGVARAEERFRQLTGKGFRAVALSGDGSPGNSSAARIHNRAGDGSCYFLTPNNTGPYKHPNQRYE